MKMKVKEFYEKFFEEYQIQNTKDITVRTRRSVFKHHILPAIGNMALGNVFASDINSIYDSMEINGYKQNTIFGVYSALGSMFSLAVEKNFISINPVREARTIHPIIDGQEQ